MAPFFKRIMWRIFECGREDNGADFLNENRADFVPDFVEDFVAGFLLRVVAENSQVSLLEIFEITRHQKRKVLSKTNSQSQSSCAHVLRITIGPKFALDSCAHTHPL